MLTLVSSVVLPVHWYFLECLPPFTAGGTVRWPATLSELIGGGMMQDGRWRRADAALPIVRFRQHGLAGPGLAGLWAMSADGTAGELAEGLRVDSVQRALKKWRFGGSKSEANFAAGHGTETSDNADMCGRVAGRHRTGSREGFPGLGIRDPGIPSPGPGHGRDIPG